MPYTSLGFEQVAATATAKTVAALTIPQGAMHAELQADTQNVRYRLDGVNPTVSKGLILLVTQPPKLFTIEQIQNMRFVRGAGSDGVLNICYYGSP